MKTRKIKIIGLGGIGSHLVEPLCRYLEHTGDFIETTVVDGDKYEEKNKNRQQFDHLDNKAAVTANLLRSKFAKVHVKVVSEYVTDDNVTSIVRENDTVFLCVDNHATRKVVSNRCKELDDVTLISGGNDFIDGNVIYYRRKSGKDVTKAPTDLYPEIANPQDKIPGITKTQSCETQLEANPQLLFTNLAIASCMCNVYYAHEQGRANFEQVYLDIVTQRARPAPEKF